MREGEQRTEEEIPRSEMAEVTGDGGMAAAAVELSSGENSYGNARITSEANVTPLSVSASFKEGKGSTSRRRASVRPSLDADDFINLLHGSDPVKVELNRLENEVRGVQCQLDLT